ncbi:ferroxidase fet3, partial [Linderina macrospora]
MFLQVYLVTTILSLSALGAQVLHDWTISNISVNLDGKHPRTVVGINGQLTMPVVRAQLGDTLILRLHNDLDEATGLHSHGIFNNGTNYYDGAGRITECGIAPKASFEYRIPLNQTGTYWLHGHHGSQYVNGLRGPLIITDPDGEPYKYDEDVVIAMEDFFPHTSHMVMAGEPDMSKMNATAMVNRQDKQQVDEFPLRDKMKAPEDKYPIPLINGQQTLQHQNLHFTPGRTYRIRLLNIGSTMMFRFAIEGHELRIIEVDGLPTNPHPVRSVEVTVAQRVSVLVTARPQATHNYLYHIEQFSDIFPELAGFNPNHQEGLVRYAGSAPIQRCNDF